MKAFEEFVLSVITTIIYCQEFLLLCRIILPTFSFILTIMYDIKIENFKFQKIVAVFHVSCPRT